MNSIDEMKNLRNWIKEHSKKWYHQFQQIGFWILIILSIGIYLGITIEKQYIQYRIHEAVTLGCFLSEKDGKVYNVTIDPMRSGKR